MSNPLARGMVGLKAHKDRSGIASKLVGRVLRALLPISYRSYPASKNLKRYRETFGRWPNILFPRTLNERVQRKILFDRNPKLTLFADKLLVREHVRKKLGGDGSLIKLYGVVSSAQQIGQLRLPPKYVMKPNHLSGELKVVRESSAIPQNELEGIAARWLGKNYFDVTQEWAYKNIRPKVMFQELLEIEGRLPEDYKFFCFNGEPRFFYVLWDRFRTPKINFYDLEFHSLPVMIRGYPQSEGESVPPPSYDKMLEASRRLSAGVAFLRVDLYDVKGKVIFGELTNYPFNGRARYIPTEWDRKFGTFWK